MQVPEVLAEIAESEAGEWQFIEIPHEEKWVHTYSYNTDIRLENHNLWEDAEEYHADWTEKLLGDARRRTYYVYHRSTPIEVVDVAIVENGNIQLPIRNVHNGNLSRFDYKTVKF